MILDLRTMSFQELQIFQQVVRCGGITAAAHEMNMAKSAVSNLLSRFEERLGVKLLTRNSRRIALTREGEYLLPRIESLLSEGERLFEQAQANISEPSGIINIASTPDVGGFIARKFFPKALAMYPQLKLIAKLSYQFEDLQDPFFDMAFRVGKVNDDDLVVKELGHIKRILVASPEFLHKHPVTEPEDLLSSSCLLFSSRNGQSVWTMQTSVQNSDDTSSDNIETKKITIESSIVVQNFHSLVQLAQDGHGICYVPEVVALKALEEGSLERCLPLWSSGPRPVYLAYRFGSEKISRIKAVLDLAKKEVPAIIANPFEA